MRTITIYLILTTSFAFGQIPNPSFELWYNNRAMGWHSLYQGSPYIFETQDTNAFHGNYALRSTIVQTGPIANVAGIMTGNVAGSYSPILNQYGYIPTTNKPTKLTGRYILANKNIDTLTANIWFKNSGTIIGTGEFKTTSASLAYSKFRIDINYTSSLQPDSFKIFVSFNHGTPSVANNVGAYFILDSLNFDVSIGLNEYDMESQVDVYPNPAFDIISFNAKNALNKIKSAEIYDSNGQLVDMIPISESFYTLGISNYNSGLYLYKLIFDNEKYKSGRFIKN